MDKRSLGEMFPTLSSLKPQAEPTVKREKELVFVDSYGVKCMDKALALPELERCIKDDCKRKVEGSLRRGDFPLSLKVLYEKQDGPFYECRYKYGFAIMNLEEYFRLKEIEKESLKQ